MRRYAWTLPRVTSDIISGSGAVYALFIDHEHFKFLPPRPRVCLPHLLPAHTCHLKRAQRGPYAPLNAPVIPLLRGLATPRDRACRTSYTYGQFYTIDVGSCVLPKGYRHVTVTPFIVAAELTTATTYYCLPRYTASPRTTHPSPAARTAWNIVTPTTYRQHITPPPIHGGIFRVGRLPRLRRHYDATSGHLGADFPTAHRACAFYRAAVSRINVDSTRRRFDAYLLLLPVSFHLYLPTPYDSAPTVLQFSHCFRNKRTRATYLRLIAYCGLLAT